MLGFIPTASFMFRSENVKKIPDWFEKCYVGDWPLKLIMTSFGYGYYIDKLMSIYRKNAKGSVTVENQKIKSKNIDGEKYIIDRRIEVLNYINDFTDYEYDSYFGKMKKQCEVEKFLVSKQEKQIFKLGYFNEMKTDEKIKCLIKIYMPGIAKIGKRILGRS